MPSPSLSHKKIFFISNCMCLCPWRLEESVRFPGVKVAVSLPWRSECCLLSSGPFQEQLSYLSSLHTRLPTPFFVLLPQFDLFGQEQDSGQIYFCTGLSHNKSLLNKQILCVGHPAGRKTLPGRERGREGWLIRSQGLWTLDSK